jgi:hypothetical protein
MLQAIDIPPFSLAGMFFGSAVRAFFGFAYPSDPVSIALKDLSKNPAFVAAVPMFLHADGQGVFRPIAG